MITYALTCQRYTELSKAATARWKNCERAIAKLLGKYGVPAERVSRASNYHVSDYDVKILDDPSAKIDGKYSLKGFATSRLLDIVKEKYCTLKEDVPMLFCKGYKERGFKTTVEGEYFVMLLAFWQGRGTKEELLTIYNKEAPAAGDEDE